MCLCVAKAPNQGCERDLLFQNMSIIRPSPRRHRLSRLLRRHVGGAALLQPTGGVSQCRLTLTSLTLSRSDNFLWTDNRDFLTCICPEPSVGPKHSPACAHFPLPAANRADWTLVSLQQWDIDTVSEILPQLSELFWQGQSSPRSRLHKTPPHNGLEAECVRVFHRGDKNSSPHLECESQALCGLCVSNHEVSVVVGKSKRRKVAICFSRGFSNFKFI